MIVVYSIEHIVKGKRYVGCTTQFPRRKDRHLRELNKNKHHCLRLQKAWDSNKFVFKILKTFKSLDKALAFELKTILEDIENKISYNTGKGFDNLSNNPNKSKIVAKISKGLKATYNSLSEKERHELFAKYGESNPNWKGAIHTTCSCGKKKAHTAITCANCQDKSGENNPFYGKTHSKATRKKLSLANRGKLPPNTNKIKIDGVLYPSQAEAAKCLGVSAATITYRLKSTNVKYKE